MSNILEITGTVVLGIKVKDGVERVEINAGEEIDLTKDKQLSTKDVERIIKSGCGKMQKQKVAEDVSKKQPDSALSEERLTQYVEAISLLDPENEEHFTQSGKPEVDNLKELIDKDVTAAERDLAWEAYQSMPG